MDPRWRGVGRRELRLRVSPVILVYMPPSCLGCWSPWILDLAALTSSPESGGARQGPSSSEADATDVYARCAQGPHCETSFSRLRRGQAVRAHAMRISCRSLSEDSPSPQPPPLAPRPFTSHLSRQGLIVSARSAVIRRAGILTDRSMPHERAASRSAPLSTVQDDRSVIFPAIFPRILSRARLEYK